MADIFISYKSERRAAAEHLAEILADYGYSVWWDYELPAGLDFGAQIEAELRAAGAVVVLWCSLSRQSGWVKEEAQLAKQLGRLIPVRIEDIELPLGFTLAQTLDLSSWDGAPRSNILERLLREIASVVGREPRANAEGLERTERAWRRFGAPPLREFALGTALEERLRTRTLSNRTVAPELSRAEVVAANLAAERPPPAPPRSPRASHSLEFCDGEDMPIMVSIPTGVFTMGSGDAEYDRSKDEGPLREVRIENMLGVGKYPVTVGEWRRFARSHDTGRGAFIWNGPNYALVADASWDSPGFAQSDDHPVTCVSWHDAKAFADWISKRTGYPYRLLSEAEWEYACRAFSEARYHTGEIITQRDANFGGVERGTGPVGLYRPNSFGLHDMAGNVWEWVKDTYKETYVGAPCDGKAVESVGVPARVVRGGSWVNVARNLRAASRSKHNSSTRINDVGFRIARVIH